MTREILKEKYKKKRAKMKQAKQNKKKSNNGGIYDGKADIEQPLVEEDEEEKLRP